MLELFWEIRQHQRISAAEAAASDSKSRATDAVEQVKQLSDAVDRLSLICMAMWSLLQERTGLSEEHLLERVRELDLKDGVADGKLTRTTKPCPRCQRPMSSKFNRCLYCGYKQAAGSAFDAV